ncbi:peptidase M16C associated-domain-containing protein [Gongronella butleri]|nr:peptidase M16C associated-domain-containing protein [Gongronella butleri]
MLSRYLCAPSLTRSARTSSLRFYSSKATLQPGQQLHGYRVQEVRRIPELELTAVALEHEATGAKHLHVDREDSNNVFAVGFHTPVEDSTGVPHILEHTTLCGSEKFPVRDPFFKMLNRSMATFMNAFTASDFTMYPFATTNKVDYDHLRSVYLDAVFHPRLTNLDFSQEGWRLEHKNATDPATPMQFKGIVYNEMKGQTSDTNYLFYTRAQEAMYPDTAYAHSSGGDPPRITDLSHGQLLQFHKTHYHPSNARFYTYGNFSLESHLENIGSYLNGFGRIDPAHANKIPQPWTEPKTIRSYCALDPMSPADKQTRLSVSYLANDVTDPFETFSMRLLSYLLMDGHASPMYKALIETNLGSEFSANTGYDSYTRVSSLSVGLQGVKDTDVQKVQDTIQSVLEQAKQDGFDPKRIEAAIHQLELGQKHKTADFGLSIMNGVFGGWFNHVNPLDVLEINKNIDRLRTELAKGQFFESRIEKYLLNNPHKLTYVMLPDADYNTKLNDEEQARLARHVDALTDADRKHILEQGRELQANQDKTEDLSCLPTLSIADISTKTKRFSLDHTGLCNTPVQWRVTATNEITYFRAISNLPPLSDELKMYLPLFCDSLLSLGTKDQSMAEIDEEIRLYTGGLRAAPMVTTNHSDIDVMEEAIALTGNCLDRNIDKMYGILLKLVQSTNFDDVEKLKTLIIGNASGMVNSIADAGHSFARTYASSTLTPTLRMMEQLRGISQVDFMNKLAKMDDLTPVSAKLHEIAQLVLKQGSMRVAVTCGSDAISKNETSLLSFLQALPEGGSHDARGHGSAFEPQYGRTFFPLPFSVNFSAKCFRGVPYTHDDGGKFQVLSSLMTQHYLHREIREKNGAYGGGASFAGLNGILSFYSYRDPNTLDTLATYDRALQWASQRDFTDQEMTEAKLSIFQSVDAPQSVSEEGMLQFVYGISDEMRQWRREQLLSVSQADIRHVVDQLRHQQNSTVLLGEQKEGQAWDDWQIKKLGV